MDGFTRQVYRVNGVDTVVYCAGDGPPLLFLHGAGTLTGFDFARPWIKHYHVILPYHPGYGESGDDRSISDMHDYVMHYVDLLDVLELEQVRVVGHSLGGWMAVRFASEQRGRVKRLVLAAPAGLRDDQNPTVDVLGLPPQELTAMLVADQKVLERYLPQKPDADFAVARYREFTSTARLMWNPPWDRKLPRYLNRLKMPVFIVWGEQDRIIPVGQLASWQKLLPHAATQVFEKAGHLVLDEHTGAVAAIARFME